MSNLQMPCIHTNGTDAAELLDQFCHAGSTLFDAMKALESASPNGRDYYPLSEGALTIAMQEHTTRINAIRDIVKELEELADFVADFV